MAEYGKRRNPEARLQAITMKLLDSGYYDIGSDEGKATLAKVAKHIDGHHRRGRRAYPARPYLCSAGRKQPGGIRRIFDVLKIETG